MDLRKSVKVVITDKDGKEHVLDGLQTALVVGYQTNDKCSAVPVAYVGIGNDRIYRKMMDAIASSSLRDGAFRKPMMVAALAAAAGRKAFSSEKVYHDSSEEIRIDRKTGERVEG